MSTMSRNSIDAGHAGRITGELGWVTVRNPATGERYFDGAHRVDMDLGSRVWIALSYHDQLPVGIVPVSDPLSGAVFDLTGNVLVSVPVDWCNFITEQEAESIAKMIEADEHLSRLAR